MINNSEIAKAIAKKLKQLYPTIKVFYSSKPIPSTKEYFAIKTSEVSRNKRSKKVPNGSSNIEEMRTLITREVYVNISYHLDPNIEDHRISKMADIESQLWIDRVEVLDSDNNDRYLQTINFGGIYNDDYMMWSFTLMFDDFFDEEYLISGKQAELMLELENEIDNQ